MHAIQFRCEFLTLQFASVSCWPAIKLVNTKHGTKKKLAEISVLNVPYIFLVFSYFFIRWNQSISLFDTLLTTGQICPSHWMIGSKWGSYQRQIALLLIRCNSPRKIPLYRFVYISLARIMEHLVITESITMEMYCQRLLPWDCHFQNKLL